MYDTMIIIPTRERPESCLELHRILEKTNALYIFCVDEDDPKVEEYRELLDDDLVLEVGPSNRLAGWLNYAAEHYVTERFKIIGFIGDDVRPRTDGWAEEIEKAMTPNGIVYANDGWQGEGLPTAVFMDADMIRKVGYMVYPELTHLYIDNHWKAWGEALGTLTYLPDVYLEHMHPFAGKAEDDAVYQRANAPEMYSKDGQAFDRFVKYELPDLVKSLG